jgi:hypothetical protein
MTEQTVKRLACAVVLTVAAFAGVVSYTHIVDLCRTHHQGGLAGGIAPLTVDGLILAGALDILHATRSNAGRPVLGWLCVWLGVVATVSANVLWGVHTGWLGATISGWPAVAFIVATHTLMHGLRRARSSAPDALSVTVPTDAEDAAAMAMRATLAAGNPLSGRQLETRFGLSRAEAARVRQLVLPSASGQQPEDPENPR